MANPEVKYRISLVWACVLIGTAALLDLLQILFSFFHVVPVVGTALALVITGYIGVSASMILFPFWLKLQFGIHWFSGKNATLKLMALGFPIIGELVPLINALPLIVAGVTLQIFISRAEDISFFPKIQGVMAPLAKQAPIQSRALPQPPQTAPVRPALPITPPTRPVFDIPKKAA